MLKKVISTAPPHSFFLQQSVTIILQGGFVISDIIFGCDDPTYNPSTVQELSLLTQYSGIATLQSLVLEEQCKGAWPIWGLTTSHITPVHLAINCGKAEC